MTTQLRTKLDSGNVADWEDNGNRLAIYGPTEYGYRPLIVFAELVGYVPAWTTGPLEYEWRAYRSDHVAHDPMIESRACDQFDSPDAVAAWLASLI